MYTQTPRNPGRLFVVPAPVPRQMISFTDGSMNKNMITKDCLSEDMKATVRCILNTIQDDHVTGGGVVQVKQVRAVGCRRIEHCARMRFPTPQQAALACVSQRPGGLRSHSLPNSPAGRTRMRFPTPRRNALAFVSQLLQRAARAFVSQLPNGLRSHSFPNSSGLRSHSCPSSQAGWARIRVPTSQ